MLEPLGRRRKDVKVNVIPFKGQGSGQYTLCSIKDTSCFSLQIFFSPLVSGLMEILKPALMQSVICSLDWFLLILDPSYEEDSISGSPSHFRFGVVLSLSFNNTAKSPFGEANERFL